MEKKKPKQYSLGNFANAAHQQVAFAQTTPCATPRHNRRAMLWPVVSNRKHAQYCISLLFFELQQDVIE
jgi:hypothetical protein